jgi:hypothetical protein
VIGDGSDVAVLDVEGETVSPLGDAGVGSLFSPRRTAGGEAAAALQRRIGAPRGARARAAALATDAVAATEIAGGRPRSRRPRAFEPAPAVTPEVAVVRPSRVRDPPHHEFSGTVAVTVGPFGDLEPVGEFAEALSGISGVASVRIRTFDRASVVFDVDLAEPTALVARLRRRSPRLLRLLYANDRIIRLKLV